MARRTLPLMLLFVLLRSSAMQNPDNADASSQAHLRQKRYLWVTSDGRLALPPGATLTITPTFSVPFVRYPPTGFTSNMTMSFPFTIYFDQLGLTDNENPFGIFPLLGRSMKSREAGMAMAEFIASFLKHGIHKREALEMPKYAFHGGERALLYGIAEDLLSTFGMNGKPCLLRAICEVQSHSLENLGFMGEILKLFFTASKSPFSNLLDDYVKAEVRGQSHGECWPYYKMCPKSLFLPSENKYAEKIVHYESESDFSESANGIPSTLNQDDSNENQQNFDKENSIENSQSFDHGSSNENPLSSGQDNLDNNLQNFGPGTFKEIPPRFDRGRTHENPTNFDQENSLKIPPRFNRETTKRIASRNFQKPTIPGM